MLNKQMRSKIDIVRHELALVFDERELRAGCLYHAAAVKHFLGFPLLAGSAHFMFQKDTGSNNTHFSYEYQGHDLSDYQMETHNGIGINTLLPEMHAWSMVGSQVLDLSTCYLPAQAKFLMGFDWDPSMIPPETFLGKLLDRKRGRWGYVPNKKATQIANVAADKVISEIWSTKNANRI